MASLIEQAFGSMGLAVDDEAVARLERFRLLLGSEAKDLGLSGIAGDREIVAKHLADSAVLAMYLERRGADGRCLVDAGTGAGVPGLVLAMLLQGLKEAVLVDSKRRAATWVGRVAQDLRLENVRVSEDRVEAFGRGRGRDHFDFGVSRALGKPSLVLEYLLPLVRVGGVAVLMIGPGSSLEGMQSAAVELAGVVEETVAYELPWHMGSRWLLVCKKTGQTPEAYPRVWAKARKRPLVFHVKHDHHA